MTALSMGEPCWSIKPQEDRGRFSVFSLQKTASASICTEETASASICTEETAYASQTSNPKLQTTNSKPQTTNSKLQMQSREPQLWSLRLPPLFFPPSRQEILDCCREKGYRMDAGSYGDRRRFGGECRATFVLIAAYLSIPPRGMSPLLRFVF